MSCREFNVFFQFCNMQKLAFQAYSLITKNSENKRYIFDPIRKKFVILSPEEWVRQHVLHFLISKKISKSHIAVERQLKVNNLIKRFDIVVFDRNGEPLILIECKSPSVKIDQSVFDQISIYNLKIKSKYLMISNGLNHLYFKIDQVNKTHIFVKDFPL